MAETAISQRAFHGPQSITDLRQAGNRPLRANNSIRYDYLSSLTAVAYKAGNVALNT